MASTAILAAQIAIAARSFLPSGISGKSGFSEIDTQEKM
jgi:hypothetical protein